MINIWLCPVICIIEGLLFSTLFVFVTKRYGRFRMAMMLIYILAEIISVYFLYRGFETVWYFFAHPYVSLLIVDLADYHYCRRDRFEKLFLWPLFILPAMSGFIMTVAWILKIRAIQELLSSF